MADEKATLENEETADDQSGVVTEEAPSVEEGTDKPQEKAELSDDEKEAAELKEAVIVEKEEIGPLRLKLTITVPRETLDGRLSKQFEELRQDSVVPGFRKGRAPLKLVEKRYASDVTEQLSSKLIGASFLAAVEKEDIKSIGDPLIWATVSEERTDEHGHTRKVQTQKLVGVTEALELITLPKEGPLTYACEVEITPEFKLPSLKKIPATRKTIKILKKDVDKEILRVQWQRARYEPVEEGAVEEDDLLYVDVKFWVDGELIESSENQEVAARPMILNGIRITDLGEALVGKSRGDTATVEAEVPDEHERIELRGKQAKFDLTVREIKRIAVPPMGEEILERMGVQSEQELREVIKTNLQARVDQLSKEDLRYQISDYLVEKAEMDLPKRVSDRQTARIVRQRMIDLYREGVSEIELQKKQDEMWVDAKKFTARDLKLSFIFDKIAEDRKVEVSDEELNGVIAGIAARQDRRFDRIRDDLSKNDGLMSLYEDIRNRKILDALIEDADITEGEASKSKMASAEAQEATET